MTRREQRKLTAELCDTREHRPTWLEYWNAVRANDDERLQWFASFSPREFDVRQRIMNVHTYRCNLLFGFTEIAFNEYGWLANPEWPIHETIEFKTNDKLDKHFTGNYISLAAGPNGKWTYSSHYQTGQGASGGYACWTTSTPLPSRDVALREALDEIRERMVSGLAYYDEYHDNTNYNPAYMRKVLELIDAAYPEKEVQLSLF